MVICTIYVYYTSYSIGYYRDRSNVITLIIYENNNSIFKHNRAGPWLMVILL